MPEISGLIEEKAEDYCFGVYVCKASNRAFKYKIPCFAMPAKDVQSQDIFMNTVIPEEGGSLEVEIKDKLNAVQTLYLIFFGRILASVPQNTHFFSETFIVN